jgi:hypothetical protein
MQRTASIKVFSRTGAAGFSAAFCFFFSVSLRLRSRFASASLANASWRARSCCRFSSEDASETALQGRADGTVK